jgi:hypothetical protein
VTDENLETKNRIIDTLKSSIYGLSKERFLNAKVFAIRVTKLRKSTILSIEPIYYSSYLDEYGSPESTYLYNSSLFLIYCGIEAISGLPERQNKFRHQFDDFCLKYQIGTKGNKIIDGVPIFFKVEGDSLIPYNKAYEKDFYKNFNELDEARPFFEPTVNSSDSV